MLDIMDRKTVSKVLAIIFAAMLSLPAIAGAEYLVPPGNSAVNQYTESFPTAGGDKGIYGGGSGADRPPATVLGERNARRLESRGPLGRAVAKAAAVTAPLGGDQTEGGEAARAGSENRAAGRTEGPARSGGPSAPSASPGAGGVKRKGEAADRASGAPSAAEPQGASRLEQVLSQATGTADSSAMGVLFPLLILAAAAWSVLYLTRQGKRPAA